MRWLLRVGLALVLVVALAGSLHVVVGAYGPRPDRAARQSLADALELEIDRGAAVAAQQQFPEGEFFSHVLTGIAQARLGGEANLVRARGHLAAAREAGVLARFGTGLLPDHGVFAEGWSLQLAVDIASASGTESDRTVAVGLASRIVAALEQQASPYLASYPGQFWPCDTVVAVAGVAAALEVPGLAGHAGRGALAGGDLALARQGAAVAGQRGGAAAPPGG